MGLRVRIRRNTYRSRLNAFDGVDELTLVNVPGDSEPTVEAPAARLVPGHVEGDLIVVPDASPEGMIGPMMGGTFVMPPDALRGWPYGAAGWPYRGKKLFGAVPLHDRFETKAQYEELSR